MATVQALNSANITKVGVVVIVALVVIGLLLSFVITAIIGRIIVLVVVVALAALTWQQRTHLKDQFDKCDLHATFFGVHFDAPQSVINDCQAHRGG